MKNSKEQHWLEWLPEPISKANAADRRHVDRRQSQAMSQGVVYRFSSLFSGLGRTGKPKNICTRTPYDIACVCLRSGYLRLPAIVLVTAHRKCST
jgi:hypothetical protein